LIFREKVLPIVSIFMRKRYPLIFSLTLMLSGCAMTEEVRRINETNQAEHVREAGRSTNLTGEQLFIRSCNTCHPGGNKGFGPTLENLGKDFPDDAKLKAFLRKGKGMMPAQPKDTINDAEMDELILYLRNLTF
jgi:mono/diheme cytochrome c family protein